MNRNMDRRISQAKGCDVLITTAEEAQSNVQMLPPKMKQCGYNSLKSPNCLNYYDGLFSTSTEMKEEFPEDECPQPSTASSCINESGIYSNVVFEKEELYKVPETRKIKQEVSEEALALIQTEEIHDKKEKFIAKTEMSEEYRILSNAGDTSVLYKVQTTPQEIQTTMCGGILKNGFHLLKHNSENIKVEPPTLVGNEVNELHKCQYCDEYFNDDNMLAHMDDVHSHKKHKSELYHKNILKTNAGRNADKINYKCNFCKRIYKSKSALVSHLTNIHYTYGRIFQCWCGEQFPTPKHLYKHKSRKHDTNIETTNNAALKIKFQCDICKKMFKSKDILKVHIKSIHYDYGRTFNCWCGKQFRTPRHLYKHKNRLHGAGVIGTNNSALKTKFECDICKKMFKDKSSLKQHILNIHCDYGKAFKCWCGKQFRTPRHLYRHKSRQHDAKAKSTNNTVVKSKFQCDICKKMFKYKGHLKQHILSIHCDYNTAFECWCGKQFRTSIYLYQHKNRQHGADGNSTNNAVFKTEFQCNICKKMFKTKYNLKTHTSIHYDYEKAFKCWCGKQFRTLIYLSKHKTRQHHADDKGMNNALFKTEFQCDICKKKFKYKGNLKRHILSIHCDYYKAFKCWCGKQFRTSLYLYKHKKQQHDTNAESSNNAALKLELQCNICNKMFKSISTLKRHITTIHYDYGVTFKCWCGKQFRTPIHLYQHKYKQHGVDGKSTNNAPLKKPYQCDVCKKMFKIKCNLKQHILSMHYDYGKTFECWCGKQFPTPIHLYQHKVKRHGPNVKNTNVVILKKILCDDFDKKKLKIEEV